MRTYLIILAIFLTISANAQSAGWQAVGPDDFKQVSYAGASNSKVYLDTLGGAYISYIQGAVGATVNIYIIKKETPAGWVQTTQVTASGLYTSLVLDKGGNFYLADDTVIAGTYAIRLRKFNGTSWSQAAPVYSVNSATRPFINMRLDKLGLPTVLYSDTGISVFPKMVNWDGSNWNAVGGTIVNTSFKPFSFDFNSMNEPFVHHYDALTNGYQVKKYNGATWTTVSNNALDATNFRIFQDTLYSAAGTDGWWGGLGPHAPFNWLSKFNGTNWITAGGVGVMGNTQTIPLLSSTGIEFDNNGTAYLTGGTIWKIQNGQTSLFGSTGDLAIKGDTFYTVDNSELHRDKLRVIKKISNNWIEEYPVSIAPFIGGGIGNYSTATSSSYTSYPYYCAVLDTAGNICLSSPRTNLQNLADHALSRFINGVWDTTLFNSSFWRPNIPYSIYTNPANNIIYFLDKKITSNSSANFMLTPLSWNIPLYAGSIHNSSSYMYGSAVFDKNGVPFITYVDLTAFGGSRVRVKKHDGANWVDVSTVMPFVSSAASENPLIVCDAANNLSVLYKESGNLYMKKFDGTNWNAIGGVIDTTSNIDFKVGLTAAGDPVVLNLKSFGGQLRPEVKKYDGANWNTVGITGFSGASAVADPSLLVDGDTTYVAYTNKSTNKIIVAKFNGTHWGALGATNISRDFSSNPNLVKSGNNLYVSYFSDGLFVKKSMSDTVVPLFQCTIPTIAVSNVGDTDAIASWSGPLPVVGYEYVISTANTPPSGNGTFISNLSYTTTGLQPNTTYYVFVRTICGLDTSAWAMQSFTTTNTTGISNTVAGEYDVSVYPNPVSWILHIEQLTAAQPRQFELYDVFGRKVRTINFSSKSIQVDISDLPAGVYSLRGISGKNPNALKIVKQ